jgi:CheY-like chemotaxis protein
MRQIRAQSHNAAEEREPVRADLSAGVRIAVDQPKRRFLNLLVPKHLSKEGWCADMRKPIAHVIDDDAAVRDSVQLLLECGGIEARPYASGEAFLREATPDDDSCLIIDVNMPGIDGLELLDQLRATGINTPAIVITGAGITGSLVSATRRLDAVLLEKPFLPGELLSSAKIALGHF